MSTAGGSTPDGPAPDGPSPGGAMALIHGIDDLEPSLGRLFVVVGVFDGLHRGHEYLLGELRREARQRNARPTVVTFDHHPDEILTGSAPPLLCDPGERLERLEAAGVAVTVVQTFDVELRETPYDAFVRRIVDRVELAGFLMTPDSAFGYQRAGTPETVAALGRELGFEVVVVPQFTLDGEPVGSSKIRAAIAAGDLREAEHLLGRPVCVAGGAHPDRASTVMTFPLPVALPPTGFYRVSITHPTWSRPLQAAARVDDDKVWLPSVDLPPGQRVALTFRDRATPSGS